MTRRQLAPSPIGVKCQQPTEGRYLATVSFVKEVFIFNSKTMYTPEKHYTTESVTAGHPDKVCDQISDAILDAMLAQDPGSRSGVEVMGSHGALVIGGEVRTNADIDMEAIARKVYTDIGYEDNLRIAVEVAKQSNDIAMGVDTGGAGDQGIMYGFATNETPEYLPEGVVLAHKLARNLENLRRSGVAWLQPDGKSQVTIENGKVTTALISTQHTEEVGAEEIRSTLIERLFKPVLGDVSEVEILVNPTGRFVQGGFMADAGLTGRKIMVDTYGGLVSHGGGCFSGKDATKVDRSAAYMCRFVAKNLVAAGHAKKAIVSVAYAIGRAEPVMVAAYDEAGKDLSALLEGKYDFRPRAIIERLGLSAPIYQKTAAYGHFGYSDRPWEQIE
jgi:S-adenosylmethionine synthetase